MKIAMIMGSVATGAALALGGCASTASAGTEPAAAAESTGGTQAPPPQGARGQGMGHRCPMQVPGTTVAAEDVEGGVALAFTTTEGDVQELRTRVQRMAAMHNRHHAGGGTMMMGGPGGQGAAAAGGPHAHGRAAGTASPQGGGGGTGKGHMMMGRGPMMPPATAEAEEVDGGARLVLRPKNPSQLDVLRKKARMVASRMSNGQCPMMSPEANGAPGSPMPAAGPKGHQAHHPQQE